MPSGEAVVLASYDRYSKSTSIFLLGITMIFVFAESAEYTVFKPNVKKLGVISILFLLAFPLYQEKSKIETLYKKEKFEDTLRYQYQKILQNYHIPTNKKYIVYMYDNDQGYFHFLTRYELQSTNVKSFYGSLNDTDKVLDEIDDYDYLILWDYDEEIKNLFTERNMFVNMNLHEQMAVALD